MEEHYPPLMGVFVHKPLCMEYFTLAFLPLSLSVNYPQQRNFFSSPHHFCVHPVTCFLISVPFTALQIAFPSQGFQTHRWTLGSVCWSVPSLWTVDMFDTPSLPYCLTFRILPFPWLCLLTDSLICEKVCKLMGLERGLSGQSTPCFTELHFFLLVFVGIWGGQGKTMETGTLSRGSCYSLGRVFTLSSRLLEPSRA